MQLLDLPGEILQEILLHAVHARGVKRALRLKLVCKIFNSCIPRALFDSLLLDTFTCRYRFGKLEVRNRFQHQGDDHGASRFWHDYLVYRVEKPGADQGSSYCTSIRELAIAYSRSTGAELKPTIRALCWMKLIQAWDLRQLEKQQPNRQIPVEVTRARNSSPLLRAAVYLGNVAMVQKLLPELGNPPSPHSPISNLVFVVAWGGHVEILELFQAIEDTRDSGGPMNAIFHAIRGAALGGNMDALRFTIARAERIIGNMHLRPRMAYASFLKGHLFQVACNDAISLEIFRYLSSAYMMDRHVCTAADQHLDYNHASSYYAFLGNQEIVRYILDIDFSGCKPDCSRSYKPCLVNTLSMAALSNHTAIVDMVLERHVNPNKYSKMYKGFPLAAAAAGGTMEIVRKLLDAGAMVNEMALMEAVRLEHTAMTELFLEWGSLDSDVRKNIREFAVKEGLESMAELLLLRQ
ncbi:hypothetical protein DM02DRAFT_674295 [Periconia macrospinosa]|uniref:Uncharacterized protein n=1 Tax=Periconia macrospinosa TaxID=97972 RepID=A0A2V1DGK7_9PLEO|nr:hypothetical protein DM02DRAFT_674295 [Periconia macrospinosa]